ncbi:ABC transporter permease [Eikenella sp. S3360]|uniref:ABC transporter permease n=1 Tax=Eikenella glucosivorans TaxID=2766967 RepID=A0ABS0N9M8_9NEIS|nr:ABC transporter permease [Eikenella glucosivorans]MBH5328975.1 ABC transporter permease [Eikenella glucosivorans]
MRQWLKNVWYLGGKEIRSFFTDYALFGLLVFMFTFSVYSVSKNMTVEMKDAAVAVYDQDRSALTYRIRDAMLAPQFKHVADIDSGQIDRAMDLGEYSFILAIPPNYTADLLAGKRPQLQLLVDATAMSQAGVGSGYIRQIVNREVGAYLGQPNATAAAPFEPVMNVLFNENLRSDWFMPLNQLVGNATLLTILLVGAAVIREREHGTIEHLLVMPVGASEIVMAKILANGLIILVSSTLSLLLVMHRVVGVPIHGSLLLFIACQAVYLFSVAGLGVLLATQAPTMPQFSLLCIIVYIAVFLLSGSTSPIENLPPAVRTVSELSPMTHFSAISKEIIFRGAGWSVIRRSVLVTAVSGALFTTLAIVRFRRMLAQQN